MLLFNDFGIFFAIFNHLTLPISCPTVFMFSADEVGELDDLLARLMETLAFADGVAAGQFDEMATVA